METIANTVPLKSAFLKVLAVPSFRSLWIGQVCSQLASNTMLFVLALRVYQQTGSNAAVSILFLVYGVPAVVFGMMAGTIVDKLENRKVLIFCDVARAILMIAFIFMYKNLLAIYFFTFLNAIITQFYVPAEAPTLPYLVPKQQIMTANSLFSFTFFSSLAVGSITAGPLLRWFGPMGVFLVLGLLFLAAGISVSRTPPLREKDRPIGEFLAKSPLYLLERLFANVEEGIKYIRSSSVLSDALLLLMGTQVILAILATLGPGFADTVLEIDIHDASLIITGPAVLGILLGALWVGNQGSRIVPKQLIHVGVLSAGIILIVISITVGLTHVARLDWLLTKSVLVPIEFFLFFLLGVSNSLLDVPANSALQRESAGAMRGRVYGMLTAAVGGIGVLPVVVGGVLADAIGPGRVIFLLGSGLLIYGVYRLRLK